MISFLFLLIELGSQMQTGRGRPSEPLKRQQPEYTPEYIPLDKQQLFRARKQIPLGYDIYYMTGPNKNVPIQITESTGPIPVLETAYGKIVAIIDGDGYVRLLRRRDHSVQINQCNGNHVQPLVPIHKLRKIGLHPDEKWSN